MSWLGSGAKSTTIETAFACQSCASGALTTQYLLQVTKATVIMILHGGWFVKILWSFVGRFEGCEAAVHEMLLVAHANVFCDSNMYIYIYNVNYIYKNKTVAIATLNLFEGYLKWILNKMDDTDLHSQISQFGLNTLAV